MGIRPISQKFGRIDAGSFHINEAHLKAQEGHEIARLGKYAGLVHTEAMFRASIIPVTLSALIWAIWSWVDFQAVHRSVAELARTDTLVRLEVLRGNIDKHRQGAVLLARHPSIVAVVGGRETASAALVLPKLVSMTDIDGATILDPQGHNIRSFPVRSSEQMPRDLPTSEAWSRARSGSLGKYWTPERYYFFAPVFVDGVVAGVAISHFSTDEAYSQLDLSRYRTRIVDRQGQVLFDNRPDAWAGRAVDIDLTDLEATTSVITQGHVKIWQWAGRSSIAALVAFLLSSLVVVLWSRRHRMAKEIQRREQQNQELEDRVAERTDALLQAQDALVKSSKLALLGQITASIAHEINQPLGAIQNYAENAVRLIEGGQVVTAIENQRKISTQARRSARILDNLRAYSKPDQIGIRPVDLGSTIQLVVQALVDRFPDSRAAVQITGQSVVSVLAGQTRLEQILMNLLVNAWNEIHGLDHPRLVIGTIHRANAIVLFVEDNGPGIDANIAGDLFEPFVSTRKHIDGLGLGLAIARQFAESMNGQLALAPSQALSGARFEITLLSDTPANRRKLDVRNTAD